MSDAVSNWAKIGYSARSKQVFPPESGGIWLIEDSSETDVSEKWTCGWACVDGGADINGSGRRWKWWGRMCVKISGVHGRGCL